MGRGADGERILSRLMTEITNEVRRAVFELGETKTSGPYGFTRLFYQKEWHVIGNQVFNMIRKFFSSDFQLTGINSSDLILISKIEAPGTISGYKPINLYNFSCKIFSKVIANSLKPMMLNKLISKSQRELLSLEDLSRITL